jgi:hypothetical protein
MRANGEERGLGVLDASPVLSSAWSCINRHDGEDYDAERRVAAMASPAWADVFGMASRNARMRGAPRSSAR